MDFDDALEEINPFGRYQKLLYSMCCLSIIPFSMSLFSPIFTQALPDYRCAIPGYPNDTYAIQNELHAELVNETVPSTLIDGQCRYSKTEVYTKAVPNLTNITSLSPTKVKCSLWVFDKTYIEESVVTEYQLVDANGEILVTLMGFAMMAGMLVGSIGFGYVSDTIGRKKTLLITIVCNFIGSMLAAFLPHPISFLIMRFLIGAANDGFAVAFVYSIEIAGLKKRVITGTIIEVFFGIGFAVLILFAYFIRNYRMLLMAMAIPNLPFLGLYFILPESPRWLLSKGKNKEAREILEKFARINKRTLPSKEIHVKQNLASLSTFVKNICKSKTLFGRTINVWFQWSVCSMAFYGLSLNAGNLGGNIFTNALALAVAEIPAYLSLLYTLNKFGRRTMHTVAMLTCGISILTTLFVIAFGGTNWIKLLFIFIGKFGIAMAFATIYVLTAEFYPTMFRNTGVGLGSTFARFGNFLSPLIVAIAQFQGGMFEKLFPLATFSSFCLAAGLLSFFLPETNNKPLPETIEDAKRLGRKSQVNNPDNVDLEDKLLNLS